MGQPQPDSRWFCCSCGKPSFFCSETSSGHRVLSFVLQLPQEKEDSLSFPGITCNTKEDPEAVEAWIQARRQLRTALESLGDIEKWLAQKPSLSRQEERCWQRIKARRADRRAAAETASTARPDVSLKCVGSSVGCPGSRATLFHPS